jgi:hypothetical protein
MNVGMAFTIIVTDERRKDGECIRRVEKRLLRAYKRLGTWARGGSRNGRESWVYCGVGEARESTGQPRGAPETWFATSVSIGAEAAGQENHSVSGVGGLGAGIFSEIETEEMEMSEKQR